MENTGRPIVPDPVRPIRLTRTKAQEKAVADGKIVECANTLITWQFFRSYLPYGKLSWITQIEHPSLPKLASITEDGVNLKGSILNQCFQLIEVSSADDYRKSEMKWSPANKKKEMLLPDMRYIVLWWKPKDEPEEIELTQVAGFISFMITYEDGLEVVYIYEIHLAEEWRGLGIGKKLMTVVEEIGKKIGVEKAMLTVFKSNSKAVSWYERLEYLEDEFSPPPRTLRNGTVKESSYIILSKSLLTPAKT